MTTHEQFAAEFVPYLLGELSPAEQAELERHLGTCGECRAELERSRTDLAMLSLSSADAAAPAAARSRLMSAVAREPRMAPRRATAGASHLGWRWRASSWAPAIAAVVLAVFGLIQWKERRELQQELADANVRLADTDARYAHARDLLEGLTAPGTMRVTLVAAGSKPQPIGRAMYMPHKGTIVFMASNLAPLPSNKVYQLWVVPKAGAPIPAGTFKPDASGGAMMMHDAGADLSPKMFAVTIEADPGASTPTMPMVMAGEAG
jgi:anti-sigma-K factor RskA